MKKSGLFWGWLGLFVLPAVFFALPGEALAAFGISPPFLNANNLLQGSKYVQTIYLVQDQPNEDLKIEPRFEISERVKGWIKINDGKEIVIPKGVRQFPLEVSIQIPKDVELGIYHGSVSFVGVPSESTGQVTIALGVQLDINLTVGTGIHREFEVRKITFLDIEEGWAPRVLLRLINKGNVAETIDGGTFDLYDKFGGVRLAYTQTPKKLPEAPPFSDEEYLVEFPVDLHLGVGQYWGGLSIFKNDKVLASQRSVFNVLKAGSLSNPLIFVWDHVGLYRNYYLFGVLVAVLGLVVFYRRKLKKLFKK